jgi:hypothetical protein
MVRKSTIARTAIARKARAEGNIQGLLVSPRVNLLEEKAFLPRFIDATPDIYNDQSAIEPAV